MIRHYIAPPTIKNTKIGRNSPQNTPSTSISSPNHPEKISKSQSAAEVGLGRRRTKNWLFFGSDKGGRTAAILTSIITTCKRLQMNPFAYLRDVFDRISAHPINRLDDLLPDNWKTAHEPTQNLPA